VSRPPSGGECGGTAHRAPDISECILLLLCCFLSRPPEDPGHTFYFSSRISGYNIAQIPQTYPMKSLVLAINGAVDLLGFLLYSFLFLPYPLFLFLVPIWGHECNDKADVIYT